MSAGFRRVRGLLRKAGAPALAVLALSGAAQPARHPQRIVSINACTDQLLFEIAAPAQIAALTHYADNPAFSRHAAAVKARGVRLISGRVEEVLKLKPDLVLAGAWTKAATRARLREHGVAVETFAPEVSVETAIAAIRKVARLTGQEARGAALIRDIEAALAAAPRFAPGQMTALQIQRRGYASGDRTLTGDVMRRMGVTNAADTLGIAGVGAVSLEAVLKAHPAVLILSGGQPGAPDQGAALLRHPALLGAYPPERRIVLPERMTECGGPALTELVRMLGRGLRRAPR